MGGRHGKPLPDSGAIRTPRAGPARKTTAGGPGRAPLDAPAAAAAPPIEPDLGTELSRVLVRHGLDLETVRLTLPLGAVPVLPTAHSGPFAAAAAGTCPDGMVRRVVCEFRNGRFVCSERCVPA